MSDTAPKIEVLKPGHQTTEYKTTKMTMILCILTGLVGIITTYLPQFMEGMAQDGKTYAVAGITLTITSIIGAVLKAMGYDAGRVKLKAPAIAATTEAARALVAQAAAAKARADADKAKADGADSSP